MIYIPESGLWAVAYTELVPRLCAAVLKAVYLEYLLWYVTPDVIGVDCEVGAGKPIALVSRVNVRECLELFEVIESTRIDQLPSSCSELTNLSVNHHPGRTGAGGDLVYYDPR